MKLCNGMVSASQVMGECSTVLWFDLASLQMTGERGGEGKEDIFLLFIIIIFCKKVCVCVHGGQGQKTEEVCFPRERKSAGALYRFGCIFA